WAIFVRPDEVIVPPGMPTPRGMSYVLDRAATRHGLHAEIYYNLESIRRRCRFWSHLAQLARAFDPVSCRRAVIVQDIAEDVGRLRVLFLRPLACGVAVADSPLFFGFNRRDQRLVFA